MTEKLFYKRKGSAREDFPMQFEVHNFMVHKCEQEEERRNQEGT